MIRNFTLASLLFVGISASAQEIIFEEKFESAETFSQWTLIDRDGDGQNWEIQSEENEVAAFTGDFLASFSWFLEAFTPDNVIVSPVIELPVEGSLNLTFKVSSGDVDLFDEHYAVYVLESGAEFTGEETPIFEETLDQWYETEAKLIDLDLSDYAGQIIQLAFRHFESDDIFYIGMDDVTVTKGTLSISENEKNNLLIYPNPATDWVKVQGINHIERIRIFDLQGKLIRETKEKELNISDLNSGTYLINIYSGKEVISRKFIKK